MDSLVFACHHRNISYKMELLLIKGTKYHISQIPPEYLWISLKHKFKDKNFIDIHISNVVSQTVFYSELIPVC